ncbi:MAG: hypothetical protein AB7L91_17810 [Dehalococcoidia bacterium]
MTTTYIRPEGMPAGRLIAFPDAVDHPEALLLEQVGPDLFRLEETPVWSEFAVWHDVVRCTIDRDGTLQCVAVVEKSPLTTVRWMLSKDQVGSERLEEVTSLALAWGGNWEQVFGGILMLHVPESRVAELKAILWPEG